MKFILLALLSFSAFSANRLITLEESSTIVFNDAFTPAYVAKKQLEFLEKSLTQKKIDLVLDTPGGSVIDGALFIDTVNGLIHGLGIQVNTITIFAASMGYITVQNLDANRYIIPSGTLMSHRASIGGISGQLPGESNTRLKYIQNYVERLSINSANRVGISFKNYMKQIQDELWLVGETAVKKNHADEVVLVVCGKSLNGNQVVKKSVPLLGTFDVTVSKCPLISGIIDVKPSNAQSQVTKDVIQYLNRTTAQKAVGL